jgi:hypothetical protein
VKEVTTKRGLLLSPGRSALATTRRSLVQEASVRERSSRKARPEAPSRSGAGDDARHLLERAGGRIEVQDNLHGGSPVSVEVRTDEEVRHRVRVVDNLPVPGL